MSTKILIEDKTEVPRRTYAKSDLHIPQKVLRASPFGGVSKGDILIQIESDLYEGVRISASNGGISTFRFNDQAALGTIVTPFRGTIKIDFE